MNIIETYYTYAKLSQAAYIDLSPRRAYPFTVRRMKTILPITNT